MTPPLVIASGQPAVSDTDGVLKTGGGIAGERGFNNEVVAQVYIQSLILTTPRSLQLSVKLIENVRCKKKWKS